jgi:molybdopterin-guanine dinucleotide biosynthesis protein A
MNCYILTGGRSTRMGTSKTVLFLDRVVAAAAPLFDAVFAVQRMDGAPLSIPTVFEKPHEGESSLHGLACALAHADGRCFVLAVDYPSITTPLIVFLLERFQASSAPALVPVWQGRPQYLCGGYDSTLLPLAEERLAGGDFAVSRFVEAAGAEFLDEALLRARFRGEPLFNVNTPEELQEAEGHDA